MEGSTMGEDVASREEFLITELESFQKQYDDDVETYFRNNNETKGKLAFSRWEKRFRDFLNNELPGLSNEYLNFTREQRQNELSAWSGATQLDNWNNTIGNAVKTYLQMTIDDIRKGKFVSFAETQPTPALAKDFEMTQSIFVVHGHDEEMKQSVARTLEKLDLEPLILHEQPNGGRTVIEKLMDYGQIASFAVVLLSPDDLAHQVSEDPTKAQYRARQNVILELGFFLGKLGRSQVVVIHKEADKFEMPSDFAGVLFVPYDSRGTWQFELVRELKEAGYKVDANVLT
jgi:predicted nucleotide-binding protein